MDEEMQKCLHRLLSSHTFDNGQCTLAERFIPSTSMLATSASQCIHSLGIHNDDIVLSFVSS